MRRLISAFLLLTQLTLANPLLEYGIPFFPESTEPTEETSALLEGAFDLSYQSKAAPRDVYGFYLKSIPDSSWDLRGVQDSSINTDPIETTQITLSLLAKDQSSAAQIVIFKETTGPVSVMITYVPDIKSFTGAQRPPPPVQKDTEDEEIVEHNEYFPLQKPLADIKRLANQGRFQELYDMGSSYFKKRMSPKYLEKELAPIRIKKLLSSYSEKTNELTTAVVRYELQKQNSTEIGDRVMYFNYEDGEWKFNNLPFLITPSMLPAAFMEKFE